jgi:hypothetical protein
LVYLNFDSRSEAVLRENKTGSGREFKRKTTK